MTDRWRKKREVRPETSLSLPAKQHVTEVEDLKQSSSSSESSLEDNESKDDKEEKEMMSKRVTEADVNALGAKRLRAELMGDEVHIRNTELYT